MTLFIRLTALFLFLIANLNLASAQEGGDFEVSAPATSIGLPDAKSDVQPPPVPGMVNVPITEQDVKVSRMRTPWSVAFFDWASVNMEKVRQGRSRLETYNYLSFDYRINYESKISFRPEFYISGAGDNFFGEYEEGKTEMGDLYLQYSHNSLGLLPLPAFIGDVGMLGAFRVYYPNSENSKRTRQITQLQARMIFTRPLGYGLEVNLHWRPKYYVQSQKTYLTEFNNVRSNQFFQTEQFVEVAKRFTSDFGISQQIGTEHRWYYGSDAENISQRIDGYLQMSTALIFNVSGVSLKGGVAYDSKIGIPNRNKQIYNERDSEYFLMTYARF